MYSRITKIPIAHHTRTCRHLTGSKASNGGGHTKTVDLSLDEIDIEGPSDDESNDDEWESATIPPPPESKRPTMIALYDYDAEDKEELSFMASDVITQLEPEDAKGCVVHLHLSILVDIIDQDHLASS